MKFESGNDRFSGVDPSSFAFFAHLHLSPFLSLSLPRETYSIGLSIFFRFHNPVRYTISRYLIARMISGSSTSRRNTRTRPLLYPDAQHSLSSLLFDGPTSNTVSRLLLLGFSLTISITRMTEWAWSLEIPTR